MARTLLAHLRQNGTRDLKETKNVRAENRFNILSARFFNTAKHPETGVVDQHVDAPKSGNASFHGSFYAYRVVDVEISRQQLIRRAERPRDIAAFAAGADYVIARFESCLGDDSPESAGRSSNEPCLFHMTTLPQRAFSARHGLSITAIHKMNGCLR